MSYLPFLFWTTVLVVLIALMAVYFFILLSPFTFRGRTIDLMNRHRDISFAVFIWLALGLYVLRSRILLAYGAIEIVGGIALGWNTLKSGPLAEGFVIWTAYMASTYLLVRGVDNVRQGLTAFKNKFFTPEYVGVSSISIEDAIRKAANDALMTNVSRYFLPPNENYRKPTKFFRQLDECEITKQTVSMETNGINYRVTIKVPSIKMERSFVSDDRYKQLEKQFKSS